MPILSLPGKKLLQFVLFFSEGIFSKNLFKVLYFRAFPTQSLPYSWQIVLNLKSGLVSAIKAVFSLKLII